VAIMEDEMNYMPLFVGDIILSTAEMTPAQFGGYMRLLCYSWSNNGLPNDMEACVRIAGGISATDWSIIRRRLVVLDEGTSEERLSHPRLEAERAKSESKYRARCEAAAKARQSREGSVSNSSSNPVSNVDTNVGSNPSSRLQPEPEPEPEPYSPERRDKNEIPNGISTSDSPTARRPRTYRIGWSAEKGFSGITDDDLARWAAANPGVDLARQIAAAHAYLVDNPAKQGKRNWAAFLGRWFNRRQERGGDTSSPTPARRRYWRGQFGKSMTDEEYESALRGQSRPQKAERTPDGVTRPQMKTPP